MANRVARIYGGEPIVNVYEFDDVRTALKVKRFDAPTQEWAMHIPSHESSRSYCSIRAVVMHGLGLNIQAMFVICNRNADADKNDAQDHNFDNRYDIVIGPVANDDLALLFRQFSNGMISVDILMREMEFKKLTDQYSFHTKEVTALLRKVDEYIVKR